MKTKQITQSAHAFFKMCSNISYSGFTEMAPTLTPLAPAFFFALAIGSAAFDKMTTWHPIIATLAAILVGIVAAAGLEAAGFMAFHSAMEAWRNGAGGKAAILPVMYLLIGITALWVVEGVESPETAVIGTALFLLAACVYASRMVMQDARARTVKTTEQSKRQAKLDGEAARLELEAKKARLRFEMEQEAKDREAARAEASKANEAKREADEADKQRSHEKNMAKIQVQKATLSAASSTASSVTDWRRVDGEIKLQLASMTTGEIQEMFPLIEQRTAREWRKRAAQLAAKVAANGQVK